MCHDVRVEARGQLCGFCPLHGLEGQIQVTSLAQQAHYLLGCLTCSVLVLPRASDVPPCRVLVMLLLLFVSLILLGTLSFLGL